MRISEMLKAIASWLESPNNEAILLSEYNDDCLKVVSESCILASSALKKAAQEVDLIEPKEDSNLTPEAIDELAEIAYAFDASGDENLRKQASVIDELLLTIAAPPNAYAERKDLQDNRAEELSKKYKENSKQINKFNNAEVNDAINKSKLTSKVRIMEEPLSSRYCPDHAGVQIARVGEHVWQCELDKKIYNFETGFTLNDGTQVPGGDVALQTDSDTAEYHTMFDTRDGRLNNNG